MKSRLSNQWVVITGASSGFGAAAALAFAREGARLLLGARRLDRLTIVAQAARDAGAPAAEVHSLDVTKTSSVDAFATRLRGLTDQLAVLINNAGGALGLDPVATGKDEDWETMLQTNVLGLLRVTRALLPFLTAHSSGYILNIGSTAGHTAYEGGAAYCAAKAGELQITRSLRLELCGTRVRVGSIDPGLAETEFSLVRFKGDTARAKKVYAGLVPLTAEDVAEAMVWAATRPPHVCIDQMLIKCTDQAEIYKIHRRS
jgi:3-hydroxy acid dehydrogenase / malonic semialdehyde reductase